MPLMLYPKCWRGLEDCKPIHCIESAVDDENLTEEQVMTLDYEIESFVCSGKINQSEHQDQYRLCFKNAETDEMSDNDVSDLSSVASVASMALFYDANMKRRRGFIEVPDMANEDNSQN